MYNFSFLINPSPKQINQITDLYRQQGWWADADEDSDLVARIIAGSHCFIIAASEDEVIGMGRAISDGASDAYIQDVAVKDLYREHGIGTMIVKKLVARLHADGINWIGLIAEKDSYEFYESAGFKIMPHSKPMLFNKQ